jgi:hypothetical protein
VAVYPSPSVSTTALITHSLAENPVIKHIAIVAHSGLQDFQLEGQAKGSLSSVAVDSPARGKVFAKTGTNVGFDSLGQHLLVQSKALAGFFQQVDGEWQVFNVVVNDAGGAPDITAALSANEDVGEVAASYGKKPTPPGGRRFDWS